VAGHQVFLASTLQWCKPKLPENTVTINPTKLLSLEEVGDKLMNEILDLLEHGHSQTLGAQHLLVIKSYVDEMLEND
jgi:hypothetical protein